jgi:hypothetical protein
MNFSRNTKLLAVAVAVVMAQPAMAQEPETSVITVRREGTSRALSISSNARALKADDPSFRIQLDQESIADFVDSLRQPVKLSTSGSREFYFEWRGFEAPELLATVQYANGVQADTVQLPAGETPSPEAVVFSAKGFIESVSFKFSGSTDTCKCFDPETCVFVSTARQSIVVSTRDLSPIEKYKTIATTAGDAVTIKTRIADAAPTEFLVTLNDRSAASSLGVRHSFIARGQAAINGAAFVGASAVESTFGTGSPLTTVHVFPSEGGLKVKADTAAHFFCNFSKTVSYPEARSLAMPLGQSCYIQPDSDVRWIYNSASPGSNVPTSKERTFSGLNVNP